MLTVLGEACYVQWEPDSQQQCFGHQDTSTASVKTLQCAPMCFQLAAAQC